MEYIGKLYGRIGPDQYFETGKTSEDWDKLELKNKQLVYKFATWLQGENFTNPDVSVHEWVETFFKLESNQ